MFSRIGVFVGYERELVLADIAIVFATALRLSTRSDFLSKSGGSFSGLGKPAGNGRVVVVAIGADDLNLLPFLEPFRLNPAPKTVLDASLDVSYAREPSFMKDVPSRVTHFVFRNTILALGTLSPVVAIADTANVGLIDIGGVDICRINISCFNVGSFNLCQTNFEQVNLGLFELGVFEVSLLEPGHFCSEILNLRVLDVSLFDHGLFDIGQLNLGLFKLGLVDFGAVDD
jgi:hypothetical protein